MTLWARVLYLPAAAAAILAQHAATALAYRAFGRPLTTDIGFWVAPVRAFGRLPLPDVAMPLAMAFVLASAAAAAWLSVRRARDAGRAHGLAMLTVVPILQIPAILILTVLPRFERPQPPPGEPLTDPAHVLAGMLAGAGLCVFAVILAALVMGAYGWGLFVLAPFFAGGLTAYLANRRMVLSKTETFAAVFLANMLGGLLLVAFALEGIVCLIMAAPLALLVAWFGGLLGRDIALQHRGRDSAAVFSVGVLPLVLALEALVPNEASILSQQSIDVAASPAQVWRAVTSPAPLETPAPLAIRLGLAYPLGSELRGEGVGAQRIGRFSTGLADERVTVWRPDRQLAFRVMTTPPSMRELSPWPTVHAPHVSGYFQTDWTSFEITPLPGGRCRLTLRNASRLRMDPAPYWEPLARWAIRANGRRVLEDLRLKAERHAT